MLTIKKLRNLGKGKSRWDFDKELTAFTSQLLRDNPCRLGFEQQVRPSDEGEDGSPSPHRKTRGGRNC